ncbi:MAG: TIGR00366 family protein [Sandaracinaceae bacterium]
MLRGIGSAFEAFFRATAPDPFVLAVLLTVVVFVAAFVTTGRSPTEILSAWGGRAGLWSLLAFTMQMVLILVTGHALAATPAVRGLIRRVARQPRTGAQAAGLVALGACVAALLNWGLGLIVGALLARDVGASCRERGVPHHYPLLVASGYVGLMLWHGGLSGSAPLKTTTVEDLNELLGPALAAAVGPVPFTSTVLSVPNLVVSGGLLLLLPVLAAMLAPRGAEAQGIEAFPGAAPEEPVGAAPVAHDDGPEEAAAAPLNVPERLSASPVTMLLIALPLASALALDLWANGLASLNPNTINLAFLAAGLVGHGSLGRYAEAIEEAARGAAGIVLQFPFYAGIMGVMRETGLAAAVATFLTGLAPDGLYGVVTFVSAGLVNLFVPSGGGQWAVQGPIALEAALRLGLEPAQVVMAVAYGDQCTNMLQPFWALPLLAITGVQARDIIGLTALMMLFGGAWMIGGILLWPLL